MEQRAHDVKKNFLKQVILALFDGSLMDTVCYNKMLK